MVNCRKLILLCLFVTAVSAQAQERLDIFGFFQANFSRYDSKENYSNPQINYISKIENERNNFLLQQLNLFFRKEISADFTAWVNFELTNSFSSDKRWGSFNLEEAWLRYTHKNWLKMKAGLLIPKFNNLNEVKNRMPYLPYIVRPLVYESSLSELLPLGDFVPEQAYFQFYGESPLARGIFNYVVYVGNSEAEFINGEPLDVVQTGIDTTEILLFGGRLGVEFDHLKLGISATLDKDNQNPIGLGAVQRTRIGGDIAVRVNKLAFEGEVITVRHDLNVPGVNLNKLFYYGTLSYDFTEQLYAYLTYNHIEDNFNTAFRDGLKGYFVGGGYRPNDAIVLKFQYIKLHLDNGVIPPTQILPVPLDINFDIQNISVAVSVFF